VALVVFAAAAVSGAQTAPPAPGEDAVQADLESALAELEAAGSPLTEDETAQLLGGGWDFGRGFLQWRQGASESCLGPGTVRADLTWRGVDFRARRGRDGCAAAPWYGSLSRETSRSSLMIGDAAMSQGHGLLSGRPGRRSTGSADQSLGATGRGLRAWPHAPSGGALQGFGAGLVVMGTRMECLVGQPSRSSSSISPRFQLVRLSTADPTTATAASVLVAQDEEGWSGSVAMSWSDARVSASGEAVGRLDRPGGRGFSGWVRLQVNPRCLIEGAAGWARGGEPSSLAVRPSWLGGWEGGGWSLRLVTTLQPGSTLKTLVSAGSTELPEGAGRRSRLLWDALWTHRMASDWRMQLRWRRQGERESLRFSRWPWLPPQDGPVETVTTLAAVMRRKWSARSLHLGLHARELAGSGEGGVRFLFTIGGEYAPGTHWILRGQWDLAWGDGVDLVSALSPLQGYVLPRHWSQWQEQRMLGVGREIGSWRFQAGTAVRDPAPSVPATGTSWEAWGDLALRW